MVSGGLVWGGSRRRNLPLFDGRRPRGGGGSGGSCRLLVALSACGAPPAAARARRIQPRLQGSDNELWGR